MGDEPSRSRLSRPLGAALVVFIGIAALWAVHRHWTPSGQDTSAFAPEEIQLDLVEAFPVARAHAGHLGALATVQDGEITIPPGSAVSWSVRMPSRGGFGATYFAAPMSRDDSGKTAALLLVESDGGLQRQIRLDTCTSGCRVALGEFGGQIARVTARAPKRGDAPLILGGPVLFGDPPVEIARGDASGSPRPPIILYLMDTLRADKLGALGNPDGLTPSIDAFAEGATIFEETIAQAPWTKPSVASIFTGQFARVHRIITMQGVLPDSALTMAELFSDHDYVTGAVVTNGLVDADFGFDQGFDHFIREKGRAPDVPGLSGFRKNKPAIDSDIAQAAVWPWLDGLEGDAPFLLYVHVLDPHAPHFPPEPFLGRFVPELDRFDLGSMESVRAMDDLARDGKRPDARERAQFESLYDAEIAHNDHQFGLFLDQLRERGIYDDALIVLVSDHGEAFWEHGHRGHGKALHEELLRVPLIVKAPHQSDARRVTSMAQHVDLLPTFADYADIERPPGLHGESLRSLIELGDAARKGLEPVIAVSMGMSGTAIRQGRWKLVKRPGPQHPLELYDIEVDPMERRNLARHHPIRVRYLLEEVSRIEARNAALSAPVEVVEREISDEKTEELRALGYIE